MFHSIVEPRPRLDPAAQRDQSVKSACETKESIQMQLYAPASSGPKRKSFRAPPLASLEGMRIGILENGKLNAEEMLREVGALFVERHGCTIRPIYSKSNASAPAPANTLVKAAQDVDFLITGLGD
jgi:hypothetical protein